MHALTLFLSKRWTCFYAVEHDALGTVIPAGWGLEWGNRLDSSTVHLSQVNVV